MKPAIFALSNGVNNICFGGMMRERATVNCKYIDRGKFDIPGVIPCVSIRRHLRKIPIVDGTMCFKKERNKGCFPSKVRAKCLYVTVAIL